MSGNKPPPIPPMTMADMPAPEMRRQAEAFRGDNTTHIVSNEELHRAMRAVEQERDRALELLESARSLSEQRRLMTESNASAAFEWKTKWEETSRSLDAAQKLLDQAVELLGGVLAIHGGEGWASRAEMLLTDVAALRGPGGH